MNRTAARLAVTTAEAARLHAIWSQLVLTTGDTLPERQAQTVARSAYERAAYAERRAQAAADRAATRYTGNELERRATDPAWAPYR